MSYFELGKSINGKGAFRVIRNAKTKKDIANFVKENPDENLYMSVYKFRETSHDKAIYDSAITDKIFIDLDSPGHAILTKETWRDLQKLIDWCRRESTDKKNLTPQIYFSGGSGYHVIFKLSHEFRDLKNPKVLQHLTKKIREVSGVETIDLQANHGYTQLRRIPNTKHQRTGLYCIPLTMEEAWNYEPEGIFRLAKKPRKGFKVSKEPSVYFDRVIQYIISHMKYQTMRDKVEGWRQKRLDKISVFDEDEDVTEIRSCIKSLMEKRNPSFRERTWIAAELLRCNYGGITPNGHYKTERLHKIFRTFIKYDFETSEWHFRKLIDKGLYAPSCDTLREEGVCEGHG